MKKLLLSLFLSCCGLYAQQKGHRISFKINNYKQGAMLLAYHNGAKQYLVDSLYADASGKFVKQGDTALNPGMYRAFLPELKKSFDILIDDENQHFSVKSDTLDFVKQMRISGSAENKRFYGYLNFLEKNRELTEQTSQRIVDLEQDSIANAQEIATEEKYLKTIDKKVRAYQEKLIAKNPKGFTAKLIAANLPVEVPEALQADELKKYHYYKEHFFDNIDFEDARFARTGVLTPKIDQYLSKQLTVQHPDSVSVAVDHILDLAQKNTEVYKTVAIHLLNTYQKPKKVCMDKVYVHLADTYFKGKEIDWLTAKQLKRITTNADDMRKSLCGEIAPDMDMELLGAPGEKRVSLHSVQARYTIIFMWNPECGHCKKAAPKLQAFYEKFKDKDLAIYAVCTKNYQEKSACTDFIQKRGLDDWINVIAPAEGSRYVFDYNMHTTPKIFVLNRRKKIVIKDLGAHQLEKVMTNLYGR